MRRAILARDPMCRAVGCTRPSTEADHIVTVAECMRAGVDPNTMANGQGLCAPHHEEKTRAEIKAAQQRGRERNKRAKDVRHPGRSAPGEVG
jgi:hypothetical protein